MYEAFINGKRVGDAWLTPGWTAYKKRLQYQVHDVTSLVAGGDNAVGVLLGNGWYRGIIGYANNINFYGKDIALLCQIDIVFTDGTSESIISDGSWKCSTGEIKYSEIYNGEIQDARLQKTGWTLAGYNDSEWTLAKEASHPLDNLVSTWNEPVKKQETFKPVKIFTTPAGEQVIDFGQNLVGWVQMKVSGPAGTKITL
jgi:alpha-L-rhamnosidase